MKIDYPQWLLNILWTDEAPILLHGTINTLNCKIWTKENPSDYAELCYCLVQFHRAHYCGTFFFEEFFVKSHWQMYILKGTWHLQTIWEKMILCLLQHNILDTVTFMQVGSRPRIVTTHQTVPKMNDHKIISLILVFTAIQRENPFIFHNKTKCLILLKDSKKYSYRQSTIMFGRYYCMFKYWSSNYKREWPPF